MVRRLELFSFRFEKAGPSLRSGRPHIVIAGQTSTALHICN